MSQSHPLKKAAADGTKKQRRTPSRKYNIASKNVPHVPFAILERYNARALWNQVHTAQITQCQPDGYHVLVKGSWGEIKAWLPQTLLPSEPFLEGDTVPLYLDEPIANRQTPPIASYEKAFELNEIERIQQAYNRQELLPGCVIGKLKGGYAIALLTSSQEAAEKGEGVRAYLPERWAALRLDEQPTFGNEPVYFAVKDFEPAKGHVIVSRREVLLSERNAQAEIFWGQAALGAILVGTVKSIVSYGAFVDVGGVDGLLHLSDTAWGTASSLESKLHVGQQVSVKIIELDLVERKLKLGIKQLQEDPWEKTELELHIGQNVEGVVIALADYGAFIRMEEGIEGLIPINEISWNKVKHPSQRLQIGQHVQARIVEINNEVRKIVLSTKALEKSPVEQLEEKMPVGTQVDVKIVRIEDFGLLIALEGGMQALIPIHELSWTKHMEDPGLYFKQGDIIQAVILAYEPARQRITCSLKRMTQDPWERWRAQYKKGSRHVVTVKRFLSHGVECELEPELLAFCATRELSEEATTQRAQDLVKIGQAMEVEVMSIDALQKRVSVSVRARLGHETQEAYQDYLKGEGNQALSKTTLGEIAEKSPKAKGAN